MTWEALRLVGLAVGGVDVGGVAEGGVAADMFGSLGGCSLLT
ncbi:hypothetical protein [Corynebacterium uterequi]|nr:hypothetical protein [Corynebacterium uterequi]